MRELGQPHQRSVEQEDARLRAVDRLETGSLAGSDSFDGSDRRSSFQLEDSDGIEFSFNVDNDDLRTPGKPSPTPSTPPCSCEKRGHADCIEERFMDGDQRSPNPSSPVPRSKKRRVSADDLKPDSDADESELKEASNKPQGPSIFIDSVPSDASHHSGLKAPILNSPEESGKSDFEVHDNGEQLAAIDHRKRQRHGHAHVGHNRSPREDYWSPEHDNHEPSLEDELNAIIDGDTADPSDTESEPLFEGFIPSDALLSKITPSVVKRELHASRLCARLFFNRIADYSARICDEVKIRPKNDDRDEDDCLCQGRLCEGTVPTFGRCSARSFRRVFAILVLIDQMALIPTFLKQGITDAHLPLSKSIRPKARGVTYLEASRDHFVLKCFKEDGWTRMAIRSFLDYQWKALSPFFSKGRRKEPKRYVLEDEIILPFRTASMSTAAALEGGQGRVTKVYIHPHHHNFHHDHSRPSNEAFAVKQLFSQDKNAFDREVEILKKFSHNAHPNLISLLATYQQNKSFYLIFPWAEADLQRYWQTCNPRPIINTTTVLWMAKQCEGIMQGVLRIHQYRTSSLSPENAKLYPGHIPERACGRHGDIKPENVLWFPSLPVGESKVSGTLKLTDFGLAEFNSDLAKSAVPSSHVGGNTPSYRPPEMDLADGRIGTSYDIWTLGCLYLEFITWLLGGWDLLYEFTEKRKSKDPFYNNIATDTFFVIDVRESDGAIVARVKPAVTEFIQELHQRPNCSQFTHNFLDLIQRDMLVVKSNNRLKRYRLTSMELHKALADMLHRCERDEGYARNGVPRGHVRTMESEAVEQVMSTEKKNEILGKLRRT